jgi:hypothetical protein
MTELTNTFIEDGTSECKYCKYKYSVVYVKIYCIVLYI